MILTFTPIDAVLAHAKSFDWVREQGANDGAPVRHFQATTGNKPPDAWCASFVSTMIRDMIPDFPFKSASCDEWLRWAKGKGILYKYPQRGDLFLSMKTPTDATHIGFVASTASDGHFATTEGNTNPAGGREGYGVFKRTRTLKPGAYNFVRWVEVLA